MYLNDKIYDKIEKLCDKGNVYVEKLKFNEAIDCFKSALDLLPTPYYDWQAATWICTSLGDVYFQLTYYEEAVKYLTEAQKCPDGLGNPFICVRLGECFFELGNMELSKEYLMQAYMLEGEEIFNDADPKYFECISALI